MGLVTGVGSTGLSPSRRLPRVGDLLILGVTLGAIALATSLPYAFAYSSAPPDKQFMGILLNVPDTAQYLSWARESGNQVLIESKLTPEPGDTVFFNLYWLLVGRLAVALGLSPAEALQTVRPLAGGLYLAAIYWFVGLVVEDRLRRWVSFLAIALGGGLGWLLVTLKQLTGRLDFPLDVYVHEANAFLTVLAFPYQATAGGLLVLALGLSALAFERGSFRVAMAAGFLVLVLGLVHGYDVLIVYAVVGATTLVLASRGNARRPVALGFAICVWSVPATAYTAYIATASPIWRGVLAQYGNAGVYTPTPAHLLVLLGLPLFLVMAGRSGLAERQPAHARELLLRSWLVVGSLLLYIPTDFQIKMLAGWQVPVGILAVRVLFTQVAPLLAKLRAVAVWRSEAVLGGLLVAAVLPTNLYLYAWRFVDLARHDYPYYLHRDEVAALRWLDVNAQPSDVVLSSLAIGQYIPSVSGKKAFLAHWAQTLDFYGKRGMVAQLFDPATPEDARVRILARHRVLYVFYGEQERALGGFDPEQAPYLTRVFSSPNALVYRVQDASRGAEVGQ